MLAELLTAEEFIEKTLRDFEASDGPKDSDTLLRRLAQAYLAELELRAGLGDVIEKHAEALLEVERLTSEVVSLKQAVAELQSVAGGYHRSESTSE